MQVAIATGASSGIGASAVMQIAKPGVGVLLTYHTKNPALTASDDHDGAAGFGPATSRVSDNSAHRIRSRAAARISAAETPDAPTLPSASPAASLHHEMPANRRFL